MQSSEERSRERQMPPRSLPPVLLRPMSMSMMLMLMKAAAPWPRVSDVRGQCPPCLYRPMPPAAQRASTLLTRVPGLMAVHRAARLVRASAESLGGLISTTPAGQAHEHPNPSTSNTVCARLARQGHANTEC